MKLDRLRELELKVKAAEMDRDVIDERYKLANAEYSHAKTEYDILSELKKDKAKKLFESRKTLFYYKEGM